MKILIIDHHELFRDGLRQMLQKLPGGVDEILEAGSFTEGLQLVRQHSALDLALLELKSPGSKGAISVKLFRRRNPHIPLVVVSSEEDFRVIKKTLDYGAAGFVCKSSSEETLLGALSWVLAGSIYVPQQTFRQHGTEVDNKNSRSDGRTSKARKYGLTERQIHILNYLTAGLSNKEIARAISLAEGTVKVHVAAVFQALRVNSRMEAAQVARHLGLVGMASVEFCPVSGIDRVMQG